MTTTTKAATFIVKVRKKESHSHGMYIRNESVLQPRSQGPPSLRPLPLQGGGKMRKSGNEVARKYELSVNWQTIIFIHSPMCRHMFVLLPTTVRRQICFGFAPIQFIMPFKLVIQKSETFAKLNLSLSHQSCVSVY